MCTSKVLQLWLVCKTVQHLLCCLCQKLVKSSFISHSLYSADFNTQTMKIKQQQRINFIFFARLVCSIGTWIGSLLHVLFCQWSVSCVPQWRSVPKSRNCLLSFAALVLARSARSARWRCVTAGSADAKVPCEQQSTVMCTLVVLPAPHDQGKRNVTRAHEEEGAFKWRAFTHGRTDSNWRLYTKASPSSFGPIQEINEELNCWLRHWNDWVWALPCNNLFYSAQNKRLTRSYENKSRRL